MNPYSNTGFFEFFGVLLHRIFLFVSGEKLSWAQDEIQLAVLGSCAIGCGLIGPFVVLKRMSMFANSLSHTSLLGVVTAFLISSYLWGSGWGDLSTLLVGALISALLTAGITEAMNRFFKLQEDASIGLVFTSLFALGVVLVTLFTRNAHISAEAVLGNPDALRLADLKLAAGLALVNALAILFLYRRLLTTAFDEPFARALGLPATLLRAALFFLTAATAIGAFRAVGVLVVLALLVGPYLATRLFCHRLKYLLYFTPLLGLASCLFGAALSRALLTYTGLPLSTAGLVALTIGLAFGAALAIQKAKSFKPSVNIPK